MLTFAGVAAFLALAAFFLDPGGCVYGAGDVKIGARGGGTRGAAGVDLAGFTCAGVKPAVERAMATDIARTKLLLLPDYPLVNKYQEES